MRKRLILLITCLLIIIISVIITVSILRDDTTNTTIEFTPTVEVKDSNTDEDTHTDTFTDELIEHKYNTDSPPVDTSANTLTDYWDYTTDCTTTVDITLMPKGLNSLSLYALDDNERQFIYKAYKELELYLGEDISTTVKEGTIWVTGVNVTADYKLILNVNGLNYWVCFLDNTVYIKELPE